MRFVVGLLLFAISCNGAEQPPRSDDRLRELFRSIEQYEAQWHNPVWPHELACVTDADCSRVGHVDCRVGGVIAAKYLADFETRTSNNCRGYQDRLKCVCIPPPRRTPICWNAMCVLREEPQDDRELTAAIR